MRPIRTAGIGNTNAHQESAAIRFVLGGRTTATVSEMTPAARSGIEQGTESVSSRRRTRSDDPILAEERITDGKLSTLGGVEGRAWKPKCMGALILDGDGTAQRRRVWRSALLRLVRLRLGEVGDHQEQGQAHQDDPGARSVLSPPHAFHAQPPGRIGSRWPSRTPATAIASACASRAESAAANATRPGALSSPRND